MVTAILRCDICATKSPEDSFRLFEPGRFLTHLPGRGDRKGMPFAPFQFAQLDKRHLTLSDFCLPRSMPALSGEGSFLTPLFIAALLRLDDHVTQLIAKVRALVSQGELLKGTN